MDTPDTYMESADRPLYLLETIGIDKLHCTPSFMILLLTVALS